MKNIFNSIVLIAFILTTILWLLPEIDYLWLDSQELNLLNANGWKSILPNNTVVYWSLLIVWGIISIGLVKRIKQFRTIYVATLVATILASFFWGFQVLTPLESGITSILGVLDGVILTMAYFTSISTSFEVKS